MDNLDNQTEEALGWAAEGKKLAVDVPEVSFKDAATFVASMTPIIGDAVAAKEVYDELQKDEPNYYLAGALGGAALIGIIPGLGDVAAKAIKKGAKEVFDVSSNVPKVSRKGTPSYTDSELLEADEIISEWGKGNLSNPELRSKLSDKGFTIETKRISPKMTGDDLEVVGPDGNIVRWKDMPRGSVDRGADAAITKDDKARLFNEGGAVVDEQMEMAFGEAGRVDPVSGNDVPPGSLPEEVRDDIPAMLSEGEYVVPADVLRFYGVKFFEDLRKEAKMGLANMEANGRIGGEPVMDEELPFSDEELMSMDMPDTEEVAAAKGGLMGFQEGGLNYPSYIKQPDLSFLGGEQGGTGLEYRVYVNEAGMTITIPFFDGEPMGMIPPGYTPQGATPAATDDDSMGGVTDTGDDDSAASVSQGKGSEDRTPINEMNANEVAETFGSTVNFDTTLGKIGLSAVGILGGGITDIIAKGLSSISGNERKKLQERADIIGLDLASVDDPYNLTRDNFTSDDAFSNAMQSVAPEGMTYDPKVTTTITNDDGSTTDITGGYTREGSSAPTTSIRPRARPDNLDSTSSDTGGGFISGGGSDGIGEYGAVGDFFGSIGDALGITNYSGQNDEDEDK